MVRRLWVLPIIGAGTRVDPRRPKYVQEAAELVGMQWNCMDYGQHPGCLMVADVTTAQRTFLSGQPDVRLVPANLNNTVGAALTATRNTLEALHIPAGWVQSGTTWREVVRAVGGLFQFAQRYAGITNGQDLLPDGVDLNLTVAEVPQARRDSLAATAASFGYDTGAITGSTTIRATLKILADQWGDDPFYLGGMVF